MSRAGWIVGRAPVGSDDVEVVHVCQREEDAKRLATGWLVAMPVYYREGKPEPRTGDRLGTWVDGTTRYAVAS